MLVLTTLVVQMEQSVGFTHTGPIVNDYTSLDLKWSAKNRIGDGLYIHGPT